VFLFQRFAPFAAPIPDRRNTLAACVTCWTWRAAGRQWNFDARLIKWVSECISAIFCAVQIAQWFISRRASGNPHAN